MQNSQSCKPLFSSQPHESSSTPELSTIRQHMSKRIRRSQHQKIVLKRRQQFIRLYSMIKISQPTLTFEQVKQEIYKYFKEIFSEERNLRCIQYLKWYPLDAFDSRRIVNFIKNVLERTESQKTKNEIYNLILMFVKEQSIAPSFTIMNVFELIDKVEYFEIWVYIADIEDIEMKACSFTSFKKLMDKVSIESFTKDQLLLFAEIVYKYMYKSTFQAHNCYYFFPHLLYMLKIKQQPAIFCFTVYSLTVFLDYPMDVKVAISNGILKQLFNQIKLRAGESELTAALSVISKVFEQSADLVKTVFDYVGNGIDLIIYVLTNCQFSKVKRSCIFILSNIIADNQDLCFQSVEKNLLITLEQLFNQAESFESVRNEIIEFIYVVLQTATTYELISKIFNVNMISMLCQHMNKTTKVEIKLKCLNSIGQWIENTRNMIESLSEKEKDLVKQDLIENKVQDVVENAALSKQKDIADVANEILKQCFDKIKEKQMIE